jgi:hypothetical protein
MNANTKALSMPTQKKAKILPFLKGPRQFMREIHALCVKFTH